MFLLVPLKPFLKLHYTFPHGPSGFLEFHMDPSLDLQLKFLYSEEATKFCEIFPLLLTVCTIVKSKGKISQNFVAFSEYMNFDYVPAELFMFPHLLGSPKIHPFGFEARQRSAGFSSIFCCALLFGQCKKCTS